MRNLLWIVILIILAANSSFSNVYYLDAVNGNDDNSGFSPSEAWKTINKVNSTAFSPGDNILFKCGQKWREQLNFPSSGEPANPIVIGDYDTGDKPVISGADIITGFARYSGSVWQKVMQRPQQVFFNEIRGSEQKLLVLVNTEREWFYDTTSSTIYIYSAGDPQLLFTSPGIEAAVRANCIYLTQDYITIRNLQLEKTSNSALKITPFASFIIADNLSLLQWTIETNWESDGDSVDGIGGIDVYGSNCEIENSVLGKNTGSDIEDEKWAGFLGIFINGPGNKVHHNFIYHTSTENENSFGNKAYGIRINNISGTTEVYNNYIYHTGSHGIYVRTNTIQNDTIKVYENTVEYAGQAGISAYRTRRDDGVGGIGLIYKNNISFANRLGGDVGGGGTQAAGIHMNDGVKTSTDPAKPYMKWYIFENIIHNSQALKKPNGADSDGIGVDFDANDVEVYRNLVYNNWGKGIYLWNSNRCKVYCNIIYGNDTGSTITAYTNSTETADYNELYNNTYYKNYNTDAYGPNYNTEIYFGGNGKYNTFKNNILYGDVNNVVYYFRDQNTVGCITDNNIVYKEGGNYAWDTYHGYQSFSQWRTNHPEWDANSINADPMFVDAAGGNFHPSASSPAIDRGVDVGLKSDFYGFYYKGLPDIGAIEYDGIENIDPLIIQSAVINNYYSVTVKFSKKVQSESALNISNYSIDKGISIISASLNPTGDQVTLHTSEQLPGETYTLTVNNLIDQYGISISSPGNSYTYNFIKAFPGNINLFAENGTLTSGAELRTKKGSIGTKVAYCSSLTSTISFNVSLPDSGIWYIWGRLFYEITSVNNSFFIRVDNDSNKVLGDNSDVFDQWHWDGYGLQKIKLGYLSSGEHIITVSGREPGPTVMIDMLTLTEDPSFIAKDTIDNGFSNIFLTASLGTPGGGTTFRIKDGSIGPQVAFCTSTSSTLKIPVNILKAGRWFAWGRLFSENTNNSFFLKVDDSTNYILGDDDKRSKQWYWVGYNSKKIELGLLTEGTHIITISGREIDSTLMLDVILLSNNPDYFPEENVINSTNDQGKEVIKEFNLSQNFPNPFNPLTIINFSLPSEVHVLIKVYNVLGKEITTLVDETKPSGIYKVEFNIGKLYSLSSGIYFYVLRAGNFVQTRKMVLLK